MTDLELIKENAILILQLDPESSEGSDLMKETQKEIISAAERMEKENTDNRWEIESLKQQLEILEESHKTLLAAMPITCGKCRLLNTVTCPRARFHHSNDKLVTETEADDHCKYAERKEE